MAVHNAYLVVILPELIEFRALDLKKLAKNMAHSRLTDLRNIYNLSDAKRCGFEAYACVGRQS